MKKVKHLTYACPNCKGKFEFQYAEHKPRQPTMLIYQCADIHCDTRGKVYNREILEFWKGSRQGVIGGKRVVDLDRIRECASRIGFVLHPRWSEFIPPANGRKILLLGRIGGD